jgi:hypothetical protein
MHIYRNACSTVSRSFFVPCYPDGCYILFECDSQNICKLQLDPESALALGTSQPKTGHSAFSVSQMGNSPGNRRGKSSTRPKKRKVRVLEFPYDLARRERKLVPVIRKQTSHDFLKMRGKTPARQTPKTEWDDGGCSSPSSSMISVFHLKEIKLFIVENSRLRQINFR